MEADTTVESGSNSGSPVSNMFSNIIILTPILCILISEVLQFYQIDSSLGYLVFSASFVYMRADASLLRSAGYPKSPSLWWCLLPLGYLWRRSSILGKSKRDFWLGVGALILAIVIGSAVDVIKAS